MNLIHALARLVPYWALPLALVFGEIAWTMRRKKSSTGAEFGCWGVAGFLVLLALGWIVMRGDKNSDEWVKGLFGSNALYEREISVC